MIELSTLPTSVQAFIQDLEHECTDANIKLVLKHTDSVQMGSMKVNGYFSDGDRTLAVALGKKRKPNPEWLHTLIHESAHMDQYLSNSRIWRTRFRGLDPSGLFALWLERVIELKPLYLYQITMMLLNIELDAEKRAIKKIKAWKLPFDLDQYVQKANAYVYFYHLIMQRREWYHISTEPYSIEQVWKQMPTTFDNDYTKLPTEYKRLFVEHCFKGIER